MLKLGSTEVNESVRDLSLLTGYSKQTISRCLRALAGRTVSDRCGKPPVLLSCRKSNRYRLVPGKLAVFSYTYTLLRDYDKRGQPFSHHTGGDCVSPNVVVLPDAFRSRRGLPKTRWAVLQAVEAGAYRSATALAEVAGCHPRTVQRALHDLQVCGLVAKVAGVWGRTEKLLETVAAELGLAGYTANLAKSYQNESRLYARRIREGWSGKLQLVRRMPEPPQDWLKWINLDRMPRAERWHHPVFGKEIHP